LLDMIAKLRPYQPPDGHTAAYQPITLLWAIGRALRGLPRTASWTQTQNELNPLLERHGEYPRAPYPLAALYRAGLWDLDGPRPVPPAHGNAPFDWFAEHQPSGGLTLDVYNLVRYSGEARVAAVDAIVELYLQDADVDALFRDVALADEEIARDRAATEEVTIAVSPAEEQYRRLCGIADRALELGARLRKPYVSFDYMRSGSSGQAVLIRSDDHCENPRCTGEPQDITDSGEPILEVDHIHDLANGGPDHPAQMIALCPNCHAIKTRGRTRERLRQELLLAAKRRHDSLLAQ
jgi:5-methylcytosine-specific restriction enzyme A